MSLPLVLTARSGIGFTTTAHCGKKGCKGNLAKMSKNCQKLPKNYLKLKGYLSNYILHNVYRVNHLVSSHSFCNISKKDAKILLVHPVILSMKKVLL